MTKEVRFSICGGVACMILLVMTLNSGCNKIPNGGVPIYVIVDSPTVVDDGVAGSATFRIPDVWAESGSTDLGAYEMPATIPVLAQGNVPLLVSAGIYDNGIISSRALYPFYKPDTFIIYNAVAGQKYHYHPVYHYYSTTQHSIIENFENGNAFPAMSRINDNADSTDHGVYCGGIVMGPNDTVTIAEQSSAPVIQTNGRAAYVELDFKKSNTTETMPFDVGIRSTDATGTTNDYPLITIFPQQYWKKTYLNFSSFIGNNGNLGGTKFQIYFIAYKHLGITGSVYFDNVKLLYFH